MKKFENTYQISKFICLLFPVWLADICFFGYAIVMAFAFVSIDIPDTLGHFLWYFAVAYIPVSAILILIGLIFDLIIAIHNKYNR